MTGELKNPSKPLLLLSLVQKEDKDKEPVLRMERGDVTLGNRVGVLAFHSTPASPAEYPPEVANGKEEAWKRCRELHSFFPIPSCSTTLGR